MRRRSKVLIVAGVLIILAILIGLLVWTVESPAPIPVQSEAQLEKGLFGGSYSTAGYNISDSSGTYFFKFGLQYDPKIPNASSTRLAVYCGLVGEQITSGFTKGVALSLQTSALLIDGQSYPNVQVSSQRESGLEIFYFGIQDLAVASGNHIVTVKVFLATIDVNYIGNTLGTYQTVSLNGSIDVTPS